MIIKGAHAVTLIKDAVVLDLGDLSRQAERLKQAAQAKADALLRDAREEATRLTATAEKIGLEQGRAKGQQQGYDQGLAQGKAEALAQTSREVQRVSQLWQSAARDVEAQRATLERDARQAVLQLALRMAEKLVHRVVEVDETVIVDQVAHALSHVLRPLDVTVRISAADRAVLEDAMPEILADFAQFQHVRLVDDAVIGPGGCVVTYGQGRVDATVETQLNRIVAMMLPGGTAVADETSRDEPRAPDQERASDVQ